jgi:hypothetical protein
VQDNSWWMPLVFAAIAAIRLIANGSKARVDADSIIFTGTLPHRLIILLGSSVALAVVLATWPNARVWERCALLSASACMALGWPDTIVLDRRSITRRSWWRRRVVIPLNEVASIEENGAGEYYIYGVTGKVIGFSKFLIDPARFRVEILARTHVKLRMASDPTTLFPH